MSLCGYNTFHLITQVLQGVKIYMSSKGLIEGMPDISNDALVNQAFSIKYFVELKYSTVSFLVRYLS